MVKYEQASTQATQEQLKYLLGRLVLNSYTNLSSYSSDMFMLMIRSMRSYSVSQEVRLD